MDLYPEYVKKNYNSATQLIPTMRVNTYIKKARTRLSLKKILEFGKKRLSWKGREDRVKQKREREEGKTRVVKKITSGKSETQASSTCEDKAQMYVIYIAM